MTQYLYIAENGIGDLLKIGITSDVPRRMREISNSSGLPTRCKSSIEFENRRSVLDAENHLHRHFKKYRTKGEWFSGVTASEIVDEAYKIKHINLAKKESAKSKRKSKQQKSELESINFDSTRNRLFNWIRWLDDNDDDGYFDPDDALVIEDIILEWKNHWKKQNVFTGEMLFQCLLSYLRKENHRDVYRNLHIEKKAFERNSNQAIEITHFLLHPKDAEAVFGKR